MHLTGLYYNYHAYFCEHILSNLCGVARLVFATEGA